jgi:hypothetical protein
MDGQSGSTGVLDSLEISLTFAVFGHTAYMYSIAIILLYPKFPVHPFHIFHYCMLGVV